MTQVVWLRSDLRVQDNPALFHALQTGEDVIACTGIAQQTWQRHRRGDNQATLINNRCHHLAAELAALRVPLRRLAAPTFEAQIDEVLGLCGQFQAKALHFNVQYEWDEAQRDQALAQRAPLRVHSYHDQCAIRPGTLKTGQGSFYSVFTPFKRRWLALQSEQMIQPLGTPPASKAMACTPSEWALNAQAEQQWPSDTASVHQRLNAWISLAHRYDQTRDLPSVDGTSQLSPYLAIGALSAQQILHALAMEHPGLYQDSGGIGTFVSEICWRDFYRNLIVEVPRVSRDQPFKLETRGMRWNTSEQDFDRWATGQTGIPIVDAAMRQLLATGWMHNRCRMIVAMFLTKNLFIHWRRGEDFFMRHLVDADLASNNGGWQWSASTGTDAAPYFRVMNPVTQSERFDPEGTYIRRWVPELNALDAKRIHAPFAKGPVHGLDYPAPMVDLKVSRQQAIDNFKAHLQEQK